MLGNVNGVAVSPDGAKKKIIEGIDTLIAFSPDGKRFAFVHEDVETNLDELRVADADGGNVKPLASKSEAKGEAFSGWGLSWSPDGKLIAVGAGSSEGGRRATVVRVDVATGEIKRLTSAAKPFLMDFIGPPPRFVKSHSPVVESPTRVVKTPCAVRFNGRGLPDGLTEKAIEAAEKVRFQPAERDGRAVSSVITLDYNFNVY